MEDQKVKELADNLRKSGLAISDYEALEKAKAIIGTDIQINRETEKEDVQETVPEKKEEGFFSHLKEKIHHEQKPELEKHKLSEPEYDISREELTVNDLMKEIGVNPDDISKDTDKIENVEEKISELKKEIIEEKENSETGNIEDIKQKVEEIKEEVRDVEKENAAEQQKNKVDLSKIFDSSKKE